MGVTQKSFQITVTTFFSCSTTCGFFVYPEKNDLSFTRWEKVGNGLVINLTGVGISYSMDTKFLMLSFDWVLKL